MSLNCRGVGNTLHLGSAQGRSSECQLLMSREPKLGIPRKPDSCQGAAPGLACDLAEAGGGSWQTKALYTQKSMYILFEAVGNSTTSIIGRRSCAAATKAWTDVVTGCETLSPDRAAFCPQNAAAVKRQMGTRRLPTAFVRLVGKGGNSEVPAGLADGPVYGREPLRDILGEQIQAAEKASVVDPEDMLPHFEWRSNPRTTLQSGSVPSIPALASHPSAPPPYRVLPGSSSAFVQQSPLQYSGLLLAKYIAVGFGREGIPENGLPWTCLHRRPRSLEPAFSIAGNPRCRWPYRALWHELT